MLIKINNMWNVIRWAILAAACCMTAGCMQVKQPEVSFQGQRISSMDLEQTTVIFDFDITNPNPIGIDEAWYDYQIDLNNSQLTKNDTYKFRMKANNVSRVGLPVKLEYAKVAGAAGSLLDAILQGKESVPYKISGDFKFNILSVPIKIPFSTSGFIPLPSVPKVKVRSIKMASLSFNSVTLKVELDILNKNKFPVKLDDFNYKLGINGKNISAGKSTFSGLAKVEGKQQMSLLVDINLLEGGSHVLPAIKSGHFRYNLDGSFVSGTTVLPYKISGQF